ncbi:BTAD domain-containing putative transcriptional regulator [Azospirillum halopraeferens]|uniref:O-linked N-acetylglucosamine transferase, SPINDLY family protein n=1 Tax=Azospirillum halopraeferens TaxID=34010 RepID=UPI000424A684|nr:hypothetical protein [Azospirillum halopraeferens]
MATIREALLIAFDHHQAGRLAEAEILYGRILQADPEQCDALHLLGVLHAQTGRAIAAVDLIAAAVARAPGTIDYHVNLAGALRAAGRPAEAGRALARVFALDPARTVDGLAAAELLATEGPDAAAAVLSRVLAVMPDQPEAWRALGRLRLGAGPAGDAVPALRRAVRLDPLDGRTHAYEAMALRAAGRTDGSVAAYRRALSLQPDHTAAHHNMGHALAEGGSADAVEPLRRAARLDAGDAATRRVLADLLRRLDRPAEAEAAVAAVLALEPLDPVAWTARGELLAGLRRPAAAAACLETALLLRPDDAGALRLLAVVREKAAQPWRAVVARLRAARLVPDAAVAAGAILALNLTDAPPADLLAAARAWAVRYADRPEPPVPVRDPDPERRLRVGYLCEGLLTHDFTALPLVENHGPAVEAVVYAASRNLDNPIMDRYRRAAARFVPVADLDNAALAARIAADGIDVLVDGTGFPSPRLRLLALAHRPAPVQVHFPVMSTTGMAAVDALLVDAALVPPGGEAAFAETLVRLPIAYHFDPLMATPDPAPPPVLRRGHITFASFNQFAKVGEAVQEAWARVLTAVPGSRLVVKAMDAAPEAEARLRAVLTGRHGIAADRIEVRGPTASLYDHYAAFRDVDVMLDTFPYCGVTTTAQALWMGVPVVTLAGRRVLDRYGASLLGMVGLDDAAATDRDGYVAAAVRLARSPERLAELRQTLRARMKATPLSDGAAFARSVEAAYRSLWRARCAGRGEETAAALSDRAAGLLEAGRRAEAVAPLHRLLALEPGRAAAWHALAEALTGSPGRLPALCRTLALSPDTADVAFALALAWHEHGRPGRAVGLLRRVLADAPARVEGWCVLASAERALGRPGVATVAALRAARVAPADPVAYRSAQVALVYDPALTPAERFEGHRELAARSVPAAAAEFRHANPPDPARRLRVAYLSGDFRDHPVARNLEPVLAAHDREAVEVLCYADVACPDAVTDRFRRLADGWCDAGGLDDAAIAGRMRADGVDVLVTLAGRFDRNRPLVAAHRAAPVQVSFHDVATSGLAATDALLADPVLAPRGSPERFVERVFRLPRYYTHAPLPDQPEPGPLPALTLGRMTFASFNNPAKTGDGVFDLWARVIAAVPGSRLVLKYKAVYADGGLRRRVLDIAARHGVAEGRVLFPGAAAERADHLALYRGVDLALDPFPFCGSTTTFEALWMGVPVLTLPGDTMVSRWSRSLLEQLDLGRFVAGSEADAIAIARRAAAQPHGLAAVRADLRRRILASSIVDGRRKAYQLERAYRALWRRWCARGTVPPFP